jgi:hypothetical protein
MRRRKKRKIPRTVREPLTGFKIVRTGKFVWLGSGAKSDMIVHQRNPTKADVFLELCPKDVFQKMMENSEQERIKGAHLITSEDLLRFFAIRAFIYGKHKDTMRETFSLLREEFGKMSMSHSRWERIQRAWLCPQAVKVLNGAAQNAFINAEVITIDEKLYPFTGVSPFMRYVPNKDPSNGHWITETTMKGATTGLPFLLNCYPVQQASGPTCLELFQSCLEWIPIEMRKNIVVVSDAYYMDNASRIWLRASGFMYMASINPTRFREVWQPLKLKVKKKGQVAVAWSEGTQEAAVHFWSPQGLKTFLLTNAFKWQKGQDTITSEVFDVAYQHTFNTADRLNHFFHKKSYPFRREGWQHNFDDFHFTSLLWNTYVLWHESNKVADRCKWKGFCKDLGQGS